MVHLPGIGTALESGETNVLWGPAHTPLYGVKNYTMDDTVTDSGNTPTTTIRGGQIVAQETASKNIYLYDADASDGRQIPVGVLPVYTNMVGNFEGSVVDQSVDVLTFCPAKVNELLGGDYQAYAVLWGIGFILDAQQGAAFLVHPLGYEQVTANKTLTAADNGKCFVCSGSANVEFTLPTIANGLSFEFVNGVNYNMTITAANLICTINNATADGIAFSTSSQKIGARVRVTAMYVGSTLKWVPELLCSNTLTVVSA